MHRACAGRCRRRDGRGWMWGMIFTNGGKARQGREFTRDMASRDQGLAIEPLPVRGPWRTGSPQGIHGRRREPGSAGQWQTGHGPNPATSVRRVAPSDRLAPDLSLAHRRPFLAVGPMAGPLRLAPATQRNEQVPAAEPPTPVGQPATARAAPHPAQVEIEGGSSFDPQRRCDRSAVPTGHARPEDAQRLRASRRVLPPL